MKAVHSHYNNNNHNNKLGTLSFEILFLYFQDRTELCCTRAFNPVQTCLSSNTLNAFGQRANVVLT